MSNGEGNSNTDDIGDRVGEGRKQAVPARSWLGETRVGVFRVAKLLSELVALQLWSWYGVAEHCLSWFSLAVEEGEEIRDEPWPWFWLWAQLVAGRSGSEFWFAGLELPQSPPDADFWLETKRSPNMDCIEGLLKAAVSSCTEPV